MVQVQQEEPKQSLEASPRGFCFGFFPCRTRPNATRALQAAARSAADGENAFLLAKFGRLDRKHFSSTWLACETSVLIQGVAGKRTCATRLEICRMVRCPKTCKHVMEEPKQSLEALPRGFCFGSFPAGLAPTTLALCRLQREAWLTGRMRFCLQNSVV